MLHIILATPLGWNSEQEVISFDADTYTSEEAKAQFEPYQGTTIDGYPYTGYEYDGEKYHDYKYIGEIDDNKAPTNKREVEYCIYKGLFN